MQTHPQSTKNHYPSSLESETPSEEDTLHAEPVSSEKIMQERGQERTERQGRSEKCSYICYLIVLLFLAAFIAAEIFLQHELSNKKTDKFIKNIQLLKQQVIRERAQISSTNSISFGRTNAEKERSSLQYNKQMGATPSTAVSQQRQKISEGFEENREQMSTQGIPVQYDIEKQNKNQQYQTLPTVLNPPMKKSFRDKPIIGSGIPQILLSKAQLRRTLTMLPFNQSNKISQEQYSYYQEKYSISQYEQLPFCIVIPTYNNAEHDRYLRNIRSIVMQNYSNFHIVVIDDASNDSTGMLILNFLLTQNTLPKNRYEIIRNEQQMRAMHNLRFAASNYCKPNDIFMIVDGDDELVGRQVLKLYNSRFQQEGLYFMYTNFITTLGRTGYSRPFPQRIITNNAYRKYPFVTSHLRAFYTQLFLNIHEKDLRDDQGEYFKAANDVAICIPILQQAHQRVTYVPQIAYFYNSNTGLNNHALRLREQRTNERNVRTRKGYAEVADLFAEY